ncbi:MAG: energy transducer TonB [Gammaproteobacteria bacterium]|jgi:outer membrane biosynthesis protein TonB|nr:energy transducer TonB [Gammaproteobacteria bacterium]
MNSTKVNVYYRSYVLPWDDFGDQEQRFRNILQRIGIATLVLCVLMSLLPVPERDVQLAQPVPPRLARLLIDKPAPIPPPPPPVVQPEPRREEAVAPVERAMESKTRPAADRKSSAREKAGKAGLLPFVDQLAELRDSKALTSITSGGTSYTGAVGDSPQVERALITSKAGVGSGGINTAGMSRNTGGSGLGGRSTTQVSSGLAALGGGGSGGSAGEEGGGDGQRASRSREEIERVFDQNKGAIYALYNRALRENPALQGKLVLKLTIEASGEVSRVEIVSSELADQELERKLVQRIRMFRFLEKDVPPVTTTKPIEFFPA